MTLEPSGTAYHFTSTGQLSSEADRNANAITFAYNPDGTLSRITDTQGRVITLTESAGRISTITGPTGRVASYGYDSSGDLTSFTDAMGRRWSYGYASPGLLSTITDPAGNVTSISYERIATVSSITYAAGSADSAKTSFAYYLAQASQCPASTTQACTVLIDADAHTSTYYFDPIGRPTMATDANGNQRSASYDPYSNVISLTDAMTSPNTTHFYYDDTSAPKALTSYSAPSGYGVTYTYGDPAHPYLPSAVTDAQGNTTTYGYDASGNVTSLTDATGHTSTQGIQGTNASCGARPGEVCYATTPAGNTTTYAYDASGNQTATYPPSPLGATTASYDSLGRPATVTNPNGASATYTYNADDQVTKVAYSDSSSAAYAYDANANLTSETGPTGTTNYGYDHQGREDSLTSPAGATSSLTYDGVGNITSYTDTGGTVAYGYDPANNLISLTEPGGSCVGAFTSGCTTFGYNNDDQLVSEYLANGTIQDYDYDADGRMLDNGVLTRSGPVAYGATYDYNNAGGTDTALVQSVQDDISGVSSTYSYDALNRLTGANTPGVADYLYGYDPDGNMTSASPNGGTSYQYATYNAADELAGTAASFDAAGNETTLQTGAALGYNSRSQTTQATPAGGSAYSLGYDGTTQDRLNADAGDSLANTLLGLGSETDTNGTTGYFTRTPDGTPISIRINGASYYYNTDNQGSVVLVTSYTGAVLDNLVYDPYGNLTAASTGSFGQPLGYLGQFYDAVGLYHLGARYYDPTEPRFTQLDPTGADPGYLYAGDNPVNLSDPAGLNYYFTFDLATTQAIAAFFQAGGNLADGALASELDVDPELSILLNSISQLGATVGDEFESCAIALGGVLRHRHPHSKQRYGCQLQITTFHIFGFDLRVPTGTISVYVVRRKG